MSKPMAEQNASAEGKPSKILLEELYAGEDDRFLEYLAQFDSYLLLQGFAVKWIGDRRPWARRQLIDYLHHRLNDPGHEVIVKRALKTAVENEDDEFLTHFMVVLDGLVRRQRSKVNDYDYRTRQVRTREFLFARPNKTIREQTGRYHEYTSRRRTVRVPLPDIRNRPANRLFSQITRAHLRRRVWRYFRFMAYRDPTRYVDAMTTAFAWYQDSHFDSGEAILDNWSLMHAGYFEAPEIAFTASHTNVVRGQSLATLKAAPYRPVVWEGEENAKKLWNLLAAARSQFIRLWTIEMLRTRHADWLANVSIEDLIQLLSSGDATVGEFAVALFREHKSLAHVAVPTWLDLLDRADFSVLPVICEAMQQHLDPTRLSDDQLVDLTMARPAAVATLGLAWLQTRHRQRPLESVQLRRLAAAGCEGEAEKIADWAIAELARPNRYAAEHLVEFFDARSPAVRQSACRWLTAAGADDRTESPADPASANSLGSPPQHDPHLWLKLVETPYDQVRFSLLELLGAVLDAAPSHLDESLSTDRYVRLLAAVILCVDRGSRSKPKSVRQLASLAVRQPQQAAVVIPVLAIAARSIRPPERAAGLSGLATIVDRHPDLASQVDEAMPEWTWQEQPSHTASGSPSGNEGTAR
jgi:hypothetical protein